MAGRTSATSKTRALVVGISSYRPPVNPLPAVAADVREIGKVLRSANANFAKDEVLVLADQDATHGRVNSELRVVFQLATTEDMVFVYLAGHGTVAGDGKYYFIPYDCSPGNLVTTGIPLVDIKAMFDRCRSQRAFLWLDFCHSGGILPRNLERSAEDERQVLRRTIEVVQGQGKLIVAACTSEQSAYEGATHGFFTGALLRGLKGEAAVGGEVTATSLFDFIDRQMGNEAQRPVMFGHMTGRIILMHHAGGTATPKPSGPAASSKSKSTAGKKAAGKTLTSAAGGTNLVVTSSDGWVLLNERFFESKSVRHSKDGTITLEISSSSADTEAAIKRLRLPQYGRSQPTPFAHNNDGFLARITEVEAVSSGDEQLWTVKLTPENSGNGGMMEMAFQMGTTHYSADDIAKLKARRILLNDPPPGGDQRGAFDQASMLEAFIRGSNPLTAIDRCAVQSVYTQYHDRPKLFLQLARLSSVYLLKASGVVEDVLDLTLGPIGSGKVHVRLRAARRSQFSQEGQKPLEVEGDCVLD